MRSWTIGDITVTQVVEFEVEIGELDGLIEQATPEAVREIPWLEPDYANADGQMLWSVHSYVVDTGSSVVVVDTGCGPGKTLPLIPNWSRHDPFLERLAAAGYMPDQVDHVLATHLHLDHVGWNTVQVDGRWVPTFPNARYTFVEEEFEYHRGIGQESAISDDLAHAVVYEGADPDIHSQTRLVFAESLQPCLDADLVDLVPMNHVVTDGVRYVSTPGHTKFHHSVMVESGGERAFITGDFIHHPVQIARPRWSSRGDFERAISADHRTDFVASSADTDLLVLGTHFAGTSAGRIVRDGDSYRLTSV
ncbi:MBL fold metallo-hydrolase [Williamsia deligens]|uniref:MBL fold metallo-hydrolase n=1 Tax=Williamsia deligens TaxID=321325 RepID=A0ABW3GAE1_9NOCA|nr:MBL fold metallo-hydrolase [Williamsia deligens]MCP2193509.1 Glyoxylase, beta-lactamase superfamily II [Williamsia deligens]